LGRPHGPLHLAGVIVGLAGGFLLGDALLNLSAVHHAGYQEIALLVLTTVEGGLFTYLAIPYLVRWWRALDHLLKTTPLANLVTGVLGMIVGLVLAVLVSNFVREFPYGGAVSAALAALLAFLGATVGLHRRGEILALAGVSEEEGGGQRRLRKVLLDTSVVIDGRILDVAATGFLDVPLVVTRSVLRELQAVADSADSMRRARGRRGLDVLTRLQESHAALLEVFDDDQAAQAEIDARLVELATAHGWAIMTNDFNLNRVAGLAGVQVLNLNDLASAMRPIAIPGEELTVTVVREGKEAGQGVGYLDDGTMVVVENGRRLLGQTVTTTVLSVLQTSAGRMVFVQATGLGEERKGRQAVR
jgi:uncharacterized protein YacL